MATFDLRTPKGLRDACREADRKLAQDPQYVERVETTAKFLQELHEASGEERQSETFLRRVWDDNPLFELGHGDYDDMSSSGRFGLSSRFP